MTANHEVGCRSRVSSVSSSGQRSASSITTSCSGARRCGRSTSKYSNSGRVGSPSGCCFCSTLPRAAARASRRAAVAAAAAPAALPQRGPGPSASSASPSPSPSSLSEAVEAVEAVLQV